jgi:hypothetical protein
MVGYFKNVERINPPVKKARCGGPFFAQQQKLLMQE